MKLLLVSHGDIARGYYETLTGFFGASNVYWANVSLEAGTSGLLEKTESYLKEWKGEQVVICSDLKGGSANQSVCRFLSEENVFLISGMNLSLLLQLMMADHVSRQDIDQYINAAREDMVLVNDILSSSSDEDDE